MNPVSPKVAVAGLVALILPAISATLLYLQTDQGAQLYAALPVWLIVVVRAIITGLATWVASYSVTDPQRVVSMVTSPKVVFATLGAIVLQAAADLIVFLTGPEGSSLYASWPPILVVAFSAVLPAAGAFIAGYLKADPARTGTPPAEPEHA